MRETAEVGEVAGWSALGAGVLVVLWTAAAQLGLGPADFATVAAGGLLVTAGASAVGFASRGTDRRRALAGAALALLPVLLLTYYLAVSDG